MKIDNMHSVSTTAQHPSFKAVHPARYFIKCEDGEFHKATLPKTVKSLQRKIITWLNKEFYASEKRINGIAPKTVKENEIDQKLRERLVKFFLGNDRDYKERQIAKSFYSTNKYNEQSAIILTGESTDILEEAVKPLGQVRKEIKTKKDLISHYYKVTIEEAKKYLSAKDYSDELGAKKSFHEDVKKQLSKILSVYSPKNTCFDAYFEPRINGKKVSYELVDAKFHKINLE